MNIANTAWFIMFGIAMIPVIFFVGYKIGKNK